MIYGIGQTPSDVSEISSILLSKSEPIEKQQTPSAESISEIAFRKFNLNWSHYLKLMRMDNESERRF